MSQKPRFTLAAPLAVLLFALPYVVQAGPYTFTNIADSSGLFSGFFTVAPVNASGTVAFSALLDTGGSGGIFTGSGGPTTTIADPSGPFAFFSEDVSINASGTVAFRAFPDAGGQGIFTGSGGPTTTIASSSGPFVDFDRISINASGTVAFFALRDAGGEGIFTGSGGPTTTIADLSPSSAIGGLSINDAGTVAFLGGQVAGRVGIFTGSGGALTTIADPSGPVAGFSSFPSINASGTVAFFGRDGVFTGSGGPTTTIVDSSGPFASFGTFSEVSINAGGTVAFGATLDAGGQGIFTSDDLSHPVIAIGDALFGSTLVGFSFVSEKGLNDAGQVAFLYVLADDRQGIARADPVVAGVPEPGTLALLAASLGALAWRARRGRRAH